MKPRARAAGVIRKQGPPPGNWGDALAIAHQGENHLRQLRAPRPRNRFQRHANQLRVVGLHRQIPERNHPDQLVFAIQNGQPANLMVAQ
jgi:hypothetical protein